MYACKNSVPKNVFLHVLVLCRGVEQSGKSKWGLSNGGLRPLSANCAQSSTIVHFCGLFGPLSQGNFRRKMTTIVGNPGQLWTSALSPHLESPHLDFPEVTELSGTGDSQRDSRRIDSRESFAIETPIFIARQADSHESLEFPIRANHPIRANRANRFARITPLSYRIPPQRSIFFAQVHSAKSKLHVLILRGHCGAVQRGHWLSER